MRKLFRIICPSGITMSQSKMRTTARKKMWWRWEVLPACLTHDRETHGFQNLFQDLIRLGSKLRFVPGNLFPFNQSSRLRAGEKGAAASLYLIKNFLSLFGKRPGHPETSRVWVRYAARHEDHIAKAYGNRLGDAESDLALIARTGLLMIS